MPRFDITVTETVTTTALIDADNATHGLALAHEMAEERSFPQSARQRADRQVSISKVSHDTARPSLPAESPAELLRRRIAAASRLKPESLAEFLVVVEATIASLEQQPFAVQVACGRDALAAELLILRGEG